MKATGSMMFLLLLVSSFLLSSSVHPAWGDPKTINVPDEYLTIQAAVDAAEPGDRIIVSAGTYNETLVVNKTVALVGESADTTVIDGNEAGHVIEVTMHGVNVTDFTISNGGAGSGGLFVHGANDTYISRNVLMDSEYGIHLQDSANNYIGENTLTNNSYGIFLERSSQNIINRNTITHSDPTAIHLERSSNLNIISGNTITNNSDTGIYLSTSDANDISNNIISRNEIDGLILTSSLWSKIRQNTISDHIFGLTSLKSNGSGIYRNNFVNNSEQAFLQNSTDVVWDNGAEGNYWSDHATDDVNGDGIGDDPYSIGVDYSDDYPLVEPWSSTRIYDVDHEGETFRVTVFCNSTVARFNFSSSLREIGFRVTGPSGNMELCNVTIPQGLLSGYVWLVLVDGADVTASTRIVENSTHTSLSFNLTFSTRTVKIVNADITLPRADAGFDQTVNEDTWVALNGSASWDDFGIVSYTWTFLDVDLQSLSGETVFYNFTNPGAYVVTLNVSDAGGNWATDAVNIMVSDVTPPIAHAGQDQTADVGATVTFDAGDSQDNVGIVSYFWDFGDNATANMTTPSTTHTYTEPGNYTVTLTVEDAAHHSDSDTITIQIVVSEATVPLWTIILLLTAVVAVGVIVAAVLLRYRRHRDSHLKRVRIKD